MNANLYLHTNSIRWNGVDNEYELLSKLSKLTVDLISFKNNSKNTHHNIKVSPQIYEVDICKSKKIIEIIEGLQREEKNYIYSILGNTSEECDLSYEELETKSMYDPGETECNAILFLNHNKTNISINPYMTFDRYQIIYNTQTLMVLYRQILGNHPGDAIHFMGECHICFPNIYFHVHCNDSIIDYLNRIPRKIVCHLACMNDCLLNFIKEKETGKDANTVLEEFAGCYGLETGSLQRNIKSARVQVKFSRQIPGKNLPPHCSLTSIRCLRMFLLRHTFMETGSLLPICEMPVLLDLPSRKELLKLLRLLFPDILRNCRMQQSDWGESVFISQMPVTG